MQAVADSIANFSMAVEYIGTYGCHIRGGIDASPLRGICIQM